MRKYRRRARGSRIEPEYEHKQIVIDTSDKESIPDLTEYFAEDREWFIDTEIVCSPIVILIVSREVGVEEEEEVEVRDEREQ
jgi:hypothetical protein